MSFNILPANPTFNTLLGQALGQAIPNLAGSFMQGRQNQQKQQGINDLLAQFFPDLDEKARKSISRSGLEAKDIVSHADKLSKKSEMAPETKRAKNLLATAQKMKGLLPYTGSKIVPGKGFGGPLNRESVQKRAKFNSLAADFAGFFRELDTKGQLPQGLYDKVIAPRLPNDELSDRENLGRIEGLEDLARRYGGLENEELALQKTQEKKPAILTARNPSTGQTIVSRDGGKTWEKS